jgi:Leucine-rich repeat (LRR) protein
VDEWGTFTTGSVRMPFSLVGQANMVGYYYVYVSASSNISIDSARTTSFVIDSKSDKVSVYSTESMQFITVPDSTVTWYNTAGNGPYTSDASDVGTASAIIGKVNVSSQPITDVRYIWALPNLTEFKSSDISFLTSISALPDTCSVLSCSGCGLSNTVGNLPRLPASLSYFDIASNAYVTFPFTTLPVSVSYFDCSDNSLTSLPALPPSLSYFDCSNNAVTSVPLMPSGTLRFFCNDNQITSLSLLPNTILTMSCKNNPITSIDYLPSQSLYINFRNTDVAGLPYMPLSVSFLDASLNTSFTSSAMGNICSQLVTNAQETGSLDFSSNGIPDVGTLVNIATLQSRNWSVSYDT